MKRSAWMMGLASAVVVAAGMGMATAGEPTEAKCPVMGEPVNLAVSTPTDNGPVYFCCKGCIKKFKADAGKYAKQVASQRKALAKRERVQVSCPISGNPVDAKVFVEHDGKKVYFCCEDCTSKFKVEPAKYKSALANAYTYQTKCPVMGGPIDPKSYTELATGERVYYCCPGCDKKFLSEPAKYVPKLAAQGIILDPEKVKKAG